MIQLSINNADDSETAHNISQIIAQYQSNGEKEVDSIVHVLSPKQGIL